MAFISIFLAILLITLWTGCVYLDYYGKSPFLFIWVLLVFFVYIPLYINFSRDFIDIAVVNSVLSFSVISLFFYLSSMFLLYLLLGYKTYEINKEIRFYKVEKKSIKIMYIGAAITCIIFWINNIGFQDFLNATFLTKRKLGVSSLFILILSTMVFSQLYFVLKSKNIFHLTIYMMFFSFILLFYKSRSIIILALLPTTYYLLFYVKSKRYKYVSLLLAAVVIISAQFIRALRYQGALHNFDMSRLFIDGITNLGNIFLEGDLAVINVYFDIIRDCNHVSWCGNYSLLESLFDIQGKSKTLEYQLYDYYIESGVNGSLHPTLFGFLYGDTGGYLGSTFFFFLGVLRVYTSVFILNSRYFYIFIGFIMYFMLFLVRGSVYNSLVFLFISLFFVTVLELRDSLVKRKANKLYK